MQSKVCITGYTGQIGSYLCDYYLQNNYLVFGLKRSGLSNSKHIDKIYLNKNFKEIRGDITNIDLINNFVISNIPDIFINCAAQSNVNVSFEQPEYTMNATGYSVKYCLDAILKYSVNTKFVTLSSSEMFGDNSHPQDEQTPFNCKSPYAEAKLFAYNITKEYRNKHDLFASNAICFNSESPRRSSAYVTKKIVQSAVKIKLGLQDKLELGNMLSMRDWSHAKDTADAIIKIATADKPDDFVISSGETHSVKEFVEKVFQSLQLDWKNYVIIDQKLFRPNKENVYCGNSYKIRSQLNWQPQYNFNSLIDDMVSEELKLMENK